MKKDTQNEIKNEVSADETNHAEAKKEKAPKITKIGAILKEMRQQKGLKIVDVSKKLCIRKCYLEAIEDSNYKEIPAFPYGIGFIRSYAAFLGLNGENIVELYKEETSSSKRKNMTVLEPQPEARMPGLQHIIISLLAIAVIYVGWFIYNQATGTTPESEEYTETSSNDYANVVIVENVNSEIDINQQNDAVVENANDQITVSNDVYSGDENTEPAVAEATQDSSEKIEEKTAEKEIPTVGIYLEILKTTWVEVKDNEKLYLSKVLQPGDTYKVPEGEGKILSVGKYDGVNVYINGILSNVIRPQKKMNIFLDKYLNPEL